MGLLLTAIQLHTRSCSQTVASLLHRGAHWSDPEGSADRKENCYHGRACLLVPADYLSALQGRAFGGTIRISFLRDVSAYGWALDFGSGE